MHTHQSATVNTIERNHPLIDNLQYSMPLFSGHYEFADYINELTDEQYEDDFLMDVYELYFHLDPEIRDNMTSLDWDEMIESLKGHYCSENPGMNPRKNR